jgi:hypothetical protein
MPFFAGRAVILDGKKPVTWRPKTAVWKIINGLAMGTLTLISTGWTIHQQAGAAMTAVARGDPVSGLRQATAGGAEEYIFGVPLVRGNKVTGKQINILPTLAALNYLDP